MMEEFRPQPSSTLMAIRAAGKQFAIRLASLLKLVERRDQLLQRHNLLLEKLEQQSRLYVSEQPVAATAFDLFRGEWASHIPGFGLGSADLFDDPRVKWLAEQLGGFAGKRILELGPLEGGHSYMIARAGAAHITAIEHNSRAFLKCLIVKNALKFDAEFILGDFQPYLANTTDHYDFALAIGVLYHVSQPAQLLVDIARVAASFGVWTHYYDHTVLSRRPDLMKKFAAKPAVQQFGGRSLLLYEQFYQHSPHSIWHRGSDAAGSYWFTRESLLELLDILGLRVIVHDDNKEHPNGPCLLLYARK